MKKIGIRKNNKGDSLILVIGCTALLSLLGIVILTKTLDNRMMKQEEARAQESFFLTDNTASEMVTVLEAAAQDAVESAFFDMMIEYSQAKDDPLTSKSAKEKRKERFGEFFGKELKQKISVTGLQPMLEAALGTTVTDMSVSYGGVEIVESTNEDLTDTVFIKNAKFSYVANGSKTTITTDINIQAKIPDVEAGFTTSVDCDFGDFALITDGDTRVTTAERLVVNGNLYVGEDLHAGYETATAGKVEVNDAKKVLVKKEIVVEENAEVKVSNTLVNNAAGEGVWANGILVNGGTVETSNANVYISDDMTLEGINPKVTMSGSTNEYVGYSGGGLTDAVQNKSSAITINNVDSLQLDLAGLDKLFINGTSYIRDDSWDTSLGGVALTVDGVMQGESLAYKDMQIMYLVPGECLSFGYNPIIGSDLTGLSMTSTTFDAGGVTLDLSNYVDMANPYVTRTDKLEGGTTIVTYVYLNFKTPDAAAAYVKDYLATPKGTMAKDKIKNLATGSLIELPATTRTLAPTMEYKGAPVAFSQRPAVSLSQRASLTEASMMAKQRYKGLFSSLQPGGGISVPLDYDLLQEAILKMDAVNTISTSEPVVIDVLDPSTGMYYKFVGCNGNYVVDDSFLYSGMTGIFLVDGDLTVSGSAKSVNGLVLVTGNVKGDCGFTCTANDHAVDVLLSHPDVAKYFQGYAPASSDGYLSSEAIDITFDNWNRN